MKNVGLRLLRHWQRHRDELHLNVAHNDALDIGRHFALLRPLKPVLHSKFGSEKLSLSVLAYLDLEVDLPQWRGLCWALSIPRVRVHRLVCAFRVMAGAAAQPPACARHAQSPGARALPRQLTGVLGPAPGAHVPVSSDSDARLLERSVQV